MSNIPTWDAAVVRQMAPVFQEWARNMEERGLIRIERRPK
jgi:hypothetical protein